MDKLTTIDKILKIVIEIMDIKSQINEEDNLFFLGLDSMNAVKLIVRLEEEFDIEIPDNDLIIEKFDSVHKIYEYVILHLNKKNVSTTNRLEIKDNDIDYKKVAVITGANRGIGFGIAKVLYRNGYVVVALNRTFSNVEWYDEIKCDLKSDDDINSAINKVVNEYGHIDILINNAGIRRFSRIDKISNADWEESIQTNLTAPLKLIQKSIKYLTKVDGMIIFIGSSAAEYAIEGGVAYSCSKAALQTMAEVAIRDLRYEGIRVSCISLGAVELENEMVLVEDDWKIQPNDVGQLIIMLTELPKRLMPAYIDLRPSKPKRAANLGIERLQYL